MLTRRSSRPAFGGRLSFFVSLLETRFIQAMFYSPEFTFSSGYPLGFCRVPGFAFGCCAGFKHFWPLALVQQAPPAILLAALRRFRGPAVFRGLRPSSRLGAPFWPSGLTLRSSRPAYGGRLIWAVRLAHDKKKFSPLLDGANN